MSRASGDTSFDTSSEQGVFYVHLARARRHLKEERYDVARSELELAHLARPNDEDVLNLLSVIEFKRGYYHEAAQAARALLKDNPNSSVLHSNLGLILFKAGVLGEAEQELRRAIELQPDHVRSHLYLGLLYRMRGKLGLALEHLRFAGAKKVVGEIEETLRRSARDSGRAPARVVSAAAASPPAANPSSSILKLAAPVPSPTPRPAEAPPPSVAVASVTPPAADRATAGAEPSAAPGPVRTGPPADVPRRRAAVTEPADTALTPGTEFLEEFVPPSSLGAPASPPAAPTGPGTVTSVSDESVDSPAELSAADREPMAAPFPEAELEETHVAASIMTASPSPVTGGTGDSESRQLFVVRSDGGLEVASRGVVFVRKGSVVWYSGKMRFAPEATFRGTRLEKILRAEGRGFLFANDPGRQAFKRDLVGQSLFVEGSRVLALDNGLSFRLEPIHDFRMNRRVDILKIHGRGSVILSVGGPLLAHEVSPEFPLNVSSRDLVAWTGDLVPSVLEDRFLEEVMMPDVGSAPKIRFEGGGTVLTEPPRPRRRASDLARTGDTDRRSS